MNDRELDRAVAERVMGIDLKPCRDRALVAVGWRYISSTGPVFTLSTGEELPVPPGEQLRAPEGSRYWNERYGLYVAEQLGERISAEVEAYREPAPPYSTDLQHAWQVVERLKDEGWWIVVKVQPEQAVVELTGMPQEIPAGARQFVCLRPLAVANTVPEAICRAALAAVEQRERSG